MLKSKTKRRTTAMELGNLAGLVYDMMRLAFLQSGMKPGKADEVTEYTCNILDDWLPPDQADAVRREVAAMIESKRAETN